MSVKQRLEETHRLKDHWCIPPEDVAAILSLIEAVEVWGKLDADFGVDEHWITYPEHKEALDNFKTALKAVTNT